MIKKILKLGVLFIVSLALIYVVVFAGQTYLIKRSLLNYVNSYDTTMLIDQDVVRCSYNILNTEVAYVELSKGYYVEEDFSIYYHYLSNPFRIFNNDWENNYIGGTDITNTTFPELVKMVKEDCSQFQKSKGNHTDETINWSYSPYTPEPVLTPDEQAVKERQDLVENLRLELEWLTEDELKAVEEKYGITKRSMDKDFIEWYEKGLKDGYFQPYVK